MRSLLRISFLLFGIVCFSFICISICEANITLPWSTTYNCADWTQFSDPLDCDGLSKGGSWSACTQNYYEWISSVANNPNGGGGKGQRHWIGDGWNVNSGGVNVGFASPQPELWVRWYFRYQTGFQWNPLSYEKLLYFFTNAGKNVTAEWYSSDKFRFYAVGGGGGYVSDTGCGWNTIFPSGISDGSWHYMEVHQKMDTNGSNGVAQLWLDGVLKYTVTNANFGTQPGWDRLLYPSNQSSPSNGGCYYYDVDDVAISNTGYIGPLQGVNYLSPPQNPSPPQNLQVQ